MTVKPLTAAGVVALLAKRYPPPAYAFATEVSNGTGRHRQRTVDAVAFGLWPSRGMEFDAFEIKVRRSDWLRERRTPEKAEEVAAEVDRFWLVTTEGVALADEIPERWGWIEASPAKGGQLVTRAKPTWGPLRALSRPFVAAFARACFQAGQRIAPAEHKRIRQLERDRADRLIECAQQEAKTLRASLDRFERVSGIRIAEYNGQALGSAVNLLLGSWPDPLRSLQAALDGLKILTEARAQLAAIMAASRRDAE